MINQFNADVPGTLFIKFLDGEIEAIRFKTLTWARRAAKFCYGPNCATAWAVHGHHKEWDAGRGIGIA